MAVALTPNAFLSRTASTAWNVFFSWCGWRRIDVDRGEFTILTYLAHNNLGSGFQFTAAADRQLVVFRVNDFADLLSGAGPTLAVGDWWFFGLTTIATSTAGNVEIYHAPLGAGSLTQVTATLLGPYGYNWHGVGARPGNDGAGGAFRLHGSVWGDRTWSDTTLTPAEMLAEFQSETPATPTGLWSSWPMETAATATVDASGNSRPLTATAGTGTITDTDGPFDGADSAEGTADLPLALALAATGQADHAGAADLPVGLALAATGSTDHTGTADLPVTFDLTAVGSAEHRGTVDLALTLAQAATGTVDRSGTVVLALGVDLAATGATIHAGSADLPVALAVAATGQAPGVGPSEGITDLTVGLALAATGHAPHQGTVDLALGLALTATSTVGPDPNPTIARVRDTATPTLADRPLARLREPL